MGRTKSAIGLGILVIAMASGVLVGCGGAADDGAASANGALSGSDGSGGAPPAVATTPAPTAAPTTTSSPASPAPVQCQSTALDEASFIDALGWGKVESEPLEVLSATRNDAEASEEYKIRSSVSGFTYTIEVLQAPKSEACFITSLLSGAPLTPLTGADANIQCESAALDAATNIDVAGWGKVDSEPLAVVSRKRDESTQSEQFQVKSTVSGFTYTVSITQAPKSEACVIDGITNGA